MANASKIFRNNYLEYASYVIKDRAIPYLEDGFKPVQRRIIHTMIEMDDGRFHKVANIVGQVMKYHPHGDASIGDALVSLANSKYFIDTQGNFGNILTGDPAAAVRYIEARILPFAKKVLFSPEITKYIPSYDGRNQEVEVFRAKLPVILLLGANGISVTMSTRILPHNPIEVIEAVKSAIKGEPFTLYPDFQTGGIVDVSEYNDGKGKVTIRSKVTVDEKGGRLVIEEVPFGITTDELIADIDRNVRLGKIKISNINDFTSHSANIELVLSRGSDPNQELKSLYAYTKAETSISLSPIVIDNNRPREMTVTEIVNHHALSLIDILKDELNIEKSHHLENLQSRTLDRIFIEERIYKKIEEMKSAEDVKKAVVDGLAPFENEFVRPVSDKDIERLLSLPIKRISLFDIEKNRKEIEEIHKNIQKTDYNLVHIKSYAYSVLDDIKKALPSSSERKTKVEQFEKIDVRSVVKRSLSLRYDNESGQLGYEVKGEELFKISEYDKILIITKDGSYRIENAPDKIYVGKGVLYVGIADKDELKNIVFTLILQEKDTKILVIKRTQILSWTLGKLYTLLPSTGQFKILKLSTLNDAEILMTFKSQRVKPKNSYFSEFLVKNPSSQGTVLTRNEVAQIKIRKLLDGEKINKSDDNPSLFKGDDND